MDEPKMYYPIVIWYVINGEVHKIQAETYGDDPSMLPLEDRIKSEIGYRFPGSDLLDYLWGDELRNED